MSDTSKKYYLAVDIGASSGRHILAHMEQGKPVLEEIYRFPNGNEIREGHRVWDMEALVNSVLEGMKKCAEAGKIPVSMGIDTWGVDYVLTDAQDSPLTPCYAYRDARTEGMDLEVYRTISEEDLYARTGIQKAIFNTIYQLMDDKRSGRLDRAEHLLMIPDYLHFCLTGVKKQEYTNATTGQLVDPVTCTWDRELIRMLGYPEKLFGELSRPGTPVGHLREEVRQQVGFDCLVVLPATHDTGSAVMSVPSLSEDTLYISSGTWSLLGCELEKANCGPEAKKANFTNEGGYDHRFRFLKNIMGLWMIQSVKEELEKKGESYSFAKLCDLAEEASIDTLVDANDGRFLAPASMIDEIRTACREQGQQVPETAGELARVIYRSLAVCYRKAIQELEHITGKSFDCIHIVGGGSNADYLNRLTAKETGKTVYAGPGEATAIGNLGAQFIADGVCGSLKDFRAMVMDAFEVKKYPAG